jgi:hypothetical protein
MATQSVEFSAPSGQAVTARLFAAGSDTVVQTASAVVEATNRDGVYTATFTDAAAGLYRLIATNSGGTLLAQWWVDLALQTATFQSYEMPISVVQSGLSTFDAASDTVANVTTVGSVSGSVGSISGVSFPANFGSLLINVSGHVSRVVLVDTTTTNSDMRGTDSAALASEWTATRAGYLDGMLLADNSNQRVVQVTGSKHMAADVHEFQPDVITSAATAASFVAEVQAGLATSAALAVVDGIVDQLKSRSGYTMSILAGAIANAQNAAEAYTITLDGTVYSVTYSGLDSSGNRTGATLTET